MVRVAAGYRVSAGFRFVSFCFNAKRLGHAHDAANEFAAYPLHLAPASVVVHGNPAALLGTVKPVFVMLKEHLGFVAFQNVQYLVAMGAHLIKIGSGLLPHLAIQAIELHPDSTS
jgi:hypothetical protein